MKQAAKWMYVLLILLMLIPVSYFVDMDEPVSPAFALLLGLLFAFTFENPFPKFNKKTSKYLLQASVVGYGFSMNLHESLKSGAEGMAFTIVSVVGVMIIGVMLGYWMHIERKTAYLISSGTAICGGSAIAAVAPVVKANDSQMGGRPRCDFHIECFGVVSVSSARSIGRHVGNAVRHLGRHCNSRYLIRCWRRRCIRSQGIGGCHAHQTYPRIMDYTSCTCNHVGF